MQILNLFDQTGFVETSLNHKFNGSIKEIASLLGAKNLGFRLVVMNPKTFSCPYHYHEKEEELCIVIEGEAIVRKNNKFNKVKSGDLLYYETGPGSVHHMYNHTDGPFKYFILSSKFREELCHYPDSQKIFDGKSRLVTQNGIEVGYTKDEEDPSIYWPLEALNGNV